jgi:hypothetical protein
MAGRIRAATPGRQLPGLPVLGSLIWLAVVLPGLL